MTKPRRNCYTCGYKATQGACALDESARGGGHVRWLRTFALVDGLPPKAADHCPSWGISDEAQQEQRHAIVSLPEPVPSPDPLSDDPQQRMTDLDERVRQLQSMVEVMQDRIYALEGRNG